MSRVSEHIGGMLASGGQSLNSWAVHVAANAPDARKVVRMGTDSSESAPVALLKRALYPATVVLTLFMSLLLNWVSLSAEYLALALISLLISVQIFAPAKLWAPTSDKSRFNFLQVRPLLDWMCAVGLLCILMVAFKLTQRFSRDVILSWFFLSPCTLVIANFAGAHLTSWVAAHRQGKSRHIIIGINEVGLELAKRVEQGIALSKFHGFFDHRSPDRLPDVVRHQLVGHCKEVADYVRRNAVDTVYIALPISTAPRIAELLQELRDTTASVYFVPDIFAFDLMHARCVDINGMPVLAVCDTPLHGMSGVRKRFADLVLASLAIAVLWPVLGMIAMTIRISSRGPILFKQRRYGLNGEEILVYKFRSMTTFEDGLVVVQATKNDQRVTRVGKFLRRTSLDELPQIFNVLEGTMSFVGPRPHAVAHNEQYRKLISGYMLRHKVRPGITGLAQINGLRGETETVEKMRARVQFDLEYLKDWSLWLDFKIILRTAVMIFRDRQAY